MGWFSPVKGSCPSLAQVDKTLPVADGNSSIERGMILTITAGTGDRQQTGAWRLAQKDDKIFYVAQQDYTDPAAGFAGDAFNPRPNKALGEGTPNISGIDLAQDGEYETDVYDPSGTYTVGADLYVKNGFLTTDNGGGGATLVGYVTSPVTDRWINNAIAVPPDGTDRRIAVRTGATKNVIRFKTAV